MPSLSERIATLRSDRPVEIRTQIVEEMMAEVTGELCTFFTCSKRDDGRVYFSNAVLRGEETLVDVIGPRARCPVLETPWMPPNTDPEEVDTFIRTRDYYDDSYLFSFDIHKKLFRPLEIGESLRAVLFDGPRLLGWIGFLRRGDDERFGKREENRLSEAVGSIKSAIAAADALERAQLADNIHGIFSPDGGLAFSTNAFEAWLNPDRREYLRRRVQAGDSGESTLGIEVYWGCEIRMSRLDGPDGVYYLVTIDRAELLTLSPTHRLTPRQSEVAEFAAAGATAREIADTLDISFHTVRDHIAAIYARLGIGSRAELGDLLSND